MSILGLGLVLLQVQLATVNGMVTRPGGSEPLGGATVTLAPVVSTKASRSVISEDDGRFAFRDIEPGEYRLQVQSPRFGTSAYGQRKPDGPGAILTIGAGQRLSDLKITMTPTGTIAGRIAGSSGEPLAYATVQALKLVYQSGKRFYAAVQTTTTDDRGEYRLFWLTSGKYIVVAVPRSGSINPAASRPSRPGETIRPGDPILILTQALTLVSNNLEGSNLTRRILEDGSIQEESWMPTYYPATVDRTQATPVDVMGGSTVTGINITLGPSPVQKIRGRVSGFTGQATVSLTFGSQASGGRIIGKGASTLDGSFEFAGVAPGPYYLTAQDRAGGVATPVAVLVGDRDLDGLSITIAPSISLSARITLEGAAQSALDPSTGVIGTLRPNLDGFEGGVPLNTLNARVTNVPLGPGNIMTFNNVAPGDYQFEIGQAVVRDANSASAGPLSAKPLYIKSIRLGRDDAFGSIHISSDTTDVLDVVLTTQTGSVEGIAINRAGDPAANTTVVLVPTNARKRTALYKTLVTAGDGKFRFQEIPPGDYKLFAWDDVETGAWENAEFIRAYESRGRTVRVSENGNEEVPLNVIYNP